MYTNTIKKTITTYITLLWIFLVFYFSFFTHGFSSGILSSSVNLTDLSDLIDLIELDLLNFRSDNGSGIGFPKILSTSILFLNSKRFLSNYSKSFRFFYSCDRIFY